MSFDNINQTFKKWDVRLIWIVRFPSSLFIADGEIQSTFKVYGVDRDSISIARNLTKISSLDQYGTGHINGIPDIRVTIVEKEEGPAFEILRRLAATNIYFDLELNLITDGQDNDSPSSDWMNGYEVFLGGRVINERSSHEIAAFPTREFECDFLRHFINEPDTTISIGDQDFASPDIAEGDGSYTENTSAFNLGGGGTGTTG